MLPLMVIEYGSDGEIVNIFPAPDEDAALKLAREIFVNEMDFTPNEDDLFDLKTGEQVFVEDNGGLEIRKFDKRKENNAD